MAVAYRTNVFIIRTLNACDSLIFHGTQIQSVRWKRKPIWLPTAKSKIFRIPQKQHLPADEAAELQRLYNIYRTNINSLSRYFHNRNKESMKTVDVHTVEENRENDFKLCSYINDLWNKEAAKARNVRLADERKNRMEQIAEKLEAKKQRDLEIQQWVDTEIKKAKTEASSFITSKNIDEAIQNALETIVDHNAAIDLNGNFHSDDKSSVNVQSSVNN